MKLTLENITNDPYQNFIDYLPNDNTRIVYLRILKRFLNVIPKELFKKNLKSTNTIQITKLTNDYDIVNENISDGKKSNDWQSKAELKANLELKKDLEVKIFNTSTISEGNASTAFNKTADNLLELFSSSVSSNELE